jgi:hypothetical protein
MSAITQGRDYVEAGPDTANDAAVEPGTHIAHHDVGAVREV